MAKKVKSNNIKKIDIYLLSIKKEWEQGTNSGFRNNCRYVYLVVYKP